MFIRTSGLLGDALVGGFHTDDTVFAGRIIEDRPVVHAEIAHALHPLIFSKWCLSSFIDNGSFLKNGQKIKPHFLPATFSHRTGGFPKRLHNPYRYPGAAPAIGLNYPC